MQHCEQLCECNKDQQQLLYRYSLAELDDLELQLQSLDMANAYTCGIVGAKKKRGDHQIQLQKRSIFLVEGVF